MPMSTIIWNTTKWLEQLLLQHPDTDGIFASSDLIAAQLLQVCAKLGRKVPEQLKIVGFDDVNIASLTTPPITTIHQPIKEMAATAVELLVRAGEGQVVPSRTTLPVSLVVRGTTERKTEGEDDKALCVTALGEVLIDFTENGSSAQGNPCMRRIRAEHLQCAGNAAEVWT